MWHKRYLTSSGASSSEISILRFLETSDIDYT